MKINTEYQIGGIVFWIDKKQIIHPFIYMRYRNKRVLNLTEKVIENIFFVINEVVGKYPKCK